MTTEKQLKERTKELTCLYRFADLIEESGLNIDAIFKGLANIIPEALLNPLKTHVEIQIYEDRFFSEGFKQSTPVYSRQISFDATIIGNIHIYSSSDKKLLHEESTLIDYLVERTGRVVQRIKFSKLLENIQNQLQEKNSQLIKKNTFLTEIVEQNTKLQKEKENNIRSNIEIVILPIIDKMELDITSTPYLDQLRLSIYDVFSSFGISIRQNYTKLTGREIEICNFIKNGLNTKEISEFLSISVPTVNKHRFNIRRKLGIVGEDINLASHLRYL